MIDSFLPQYPLINEDEFEYDIARRKEFSELKLEPSEEVKPDSLLKHQQIIQRFISGHTPYTELLIDHGVGTGKCVLPDTLVLTQEGEIPIGDLWRTKGSDMVYNDSSGGNWMPPSEDLIVPCYNTDTSSSAFGKVVNLYRQRIEESIWVVTFDDGSVMRMTQKHKLLVLDNPDKNSQTLVPNWTTNFYPGTVVLKLDGYKTVKTCHHVYYSGFVYDLEVEHYHTYIANGLISHNTCSISAVVENFKNVLVGGEKRKPALIFLPAEGDIARYKSEIVDVCTKGVYKVQITKEDRARGIAILSDEMRKIRITKALEDTYEFVTPRTFFRKTISDAYVKSNYSDRVIVIDEAHHLRIQPGKKKKVKEQKELYKSMHHFLHTVERCRILLATATPIWDQANEIASLMNLILPLGQQLPTGSKFDKEYFDDEGNLVNSESLVELFRGRVSFLRPMITTAQREEVGIRKPWFRFLKVYPDGMSAFQAKYADEARKFVRIQKVKKKKRVKVDEEEREIMVDIERRIEGGELLKEARGATIFIYPEKIENGKLVEGSFGTFAKHVVRKRVVPKLIKRKGKEVRIEVEEKTYKLDDITREAVRSHLDQVSIKFASILHFVKQAPNELAFVFTGDFVEEGAILLGLTLKEHGFTEVRDPKQVKTPGRRFAIMTSNLQTLHSDTQIENLLKVFNDPKNRYGDYIQVLIGSRKVGERLTIKNLRQMHELTPHWNLSIEDQGFGRGFRVGSHDALKPEERYVKEYRHTALIRGDERKEKGFPASVGFSEEPTIDVHVYSIAENKEYRKTQITRLVKVSSVDCPLTYKRNVLQTDTNGSRDCDFIECNYECQGFPPTDTDGKVWSYDVEDIITDSYNAFYSSKEVSAVITRVVDLFNSHFSLHLDEIGPLVEVNDEAILLFALDIIIDRRLLIRNRYGFGCYLKESNNIFFLDNNITPKSNYPSSTYVENPLVTERTSLEDFVEIRQLSDDKDLVRDFCKEPTEEVLKKMHYKTQIILLEEAYASETSTKAEKMVLALLNDNLYETSDGKVVHLLYTSEFTGISYNVIAKNIIANGLTRVYDPERREWNFVESLEKEKGYIEEIKASQQGEAQKGFENNPYGVYGTVSKLDGKFRMRIKTDKGGARGGRVCDSWLYNDLLDIFDRIKYLPKASPQYASKNKASLIPAIRGLINLPAKRKKKLEGQTEKRLRKLLTLYTMSNDQLCATLKSWFKKNNLLFEI